MDPLEMVEGLDPMAMEAIMDPLEIVEGLDPVEMEAIMDLLEMVEDLDLMAMMATEAQMETRILVVVASMASLHLML